MQAGEGRGLLELLGGRQLDQHAGRPAPLRWQAQVVRQVHGVVERLGTPTNRPIRCADLTLNSVYTCLGASHGTRLGRFIRGEVKLSADVKGGQNATLRLCGARFYFFNQRAPNLPRLGFRGLPAPCSFFSVPCRSFLTTSAPLASLAFHPPVFMFVRRLVVVLTPRRLLRRDSLLSELISRLNKGFFSQTDFGDVGS